MIDIKDLISVQEIEVILEKFLNSKLDMMGSNIYIGTVVDNNDPDKLGRVKVNIIGKYDGISTTDLPWARPETKSVSGNFMIPNLNDKLLVRVDDIYDPVYVGKYFSESTRSDILDDSYPNTAVIYEDEQGTSISVNKKIHSMLITHKSGSSIEFKDNGDIDIRPNKNLNLITDKGSVNLNDNLISEGSILKRLLLGGSSAIIPLPNLPVTPPPGQPLAPAQQKVFTV